MIAHTFTVDHDLLSTSLRCRDGETKCRVLVGLQAVFHNGG